MRGLCCVPVCTTFGNRLAAPLWCVGRAYRLSGCGYSHSIVAGGLELMS